MLPGSVAAVAARAVGFAIFASRSASAAGERVARAGCCATCHTTAEGAPYAGGCPVETGFGIIHGTIITPDPATGIRRWSLEALRRSILEGGARDESHLFPAFPHGHFTLTSNADIGGPCACLVMLPPHPDEAFATTVPFPPNIRMFPLRMGDGPEEDGPEVDGPEVDGPEEDGPEEDVPEEIALIDDGQVPCGPGEPATTVIAPATGNAIFAATGARLRQLPMRPADMRAALAAFQNPAHGRTPYRGTGSDPAGSTSVPFDLLRHRGRAPQEGNTAIPCSGVWRIDA